MHIMYTHAHSYKMSESNANELAFRKQNNYTNIHKHAYRKGTQKLIYINIGNMYTTYYIYISFTCDYNVLPSIRVCVYIYDMHIEMTMR